MPPPTVEEGKSLLGAQFLCIDPSQTKRRAYSAILWELPDWKIVTAAARYATDATVNEAEYRGLLLGFDLLSDQARGRIIICSDSNLVIRQMRR